jgi:hypothetical protein
MAGRKMAKRLLADMAALGGVEYLTDYIGDGGTVQALANNLNCSRSFLSRVLNGNPEYRQALADGRKIGADKLADDALNIMDDLTDKPALTSADVQLAKERVHVRKWLAAMNDPDRFAEKKQADTIINIGELHLGALKKLRGEMLNVTPTVAEIVDVSRAEDD